MFEVRIHGRGGQGVVTAAEMLSLAAFIEGRYAQAFPSFGSERMGAPVVSFCRIDDHEIRVREPVMEPDAVIIQDPTLLHQVDVFGGCKRGRLHPHQHRQELRRARSGRVREGLPPRAAAHGAGRQTSRASTPGERSPTPRCSAGSRR